MATVEELLPGDLVSEPDGTAAVFLTACPHPVWHHLLLVIWRMKADDTVRLDAMYPQQEAGEVQPIEPAARADRLKDELVTAAQVMRHDIGLRRREAWD
jgi:hypothetical protein